jgi:hypothetical protein
MMSAASFCLASARRGEPAHHGPVPADADGLSLFRFEGAALLWVGPGDVPTGVGQSTMSGPGRAPRELPGLRSTSVQAARVSLDCVRAGGGPLTPCVPWSGCSSRRVPFGLFGVLDRGVRPRVRAVQPLENSKASTSIFVLQATKSQRRMPWRLKPKKDVGDCEKPREAVYQASIRGCPNGATQHLS